jgi:hypothetical protein
MTGMSCPRISFLMGPPIELHSLTLRFLTPARDTLRMISTRAKPTSVADSDSDAAPSAAVPVINSSLEYEKSPNRISRRQMNLLLLLIAINTLLFSAFVCLPTASPYLKEMWSQYQQKRDEKRNAEARESKLAANMVFVAPADRAIYVEAPADARALLNTDAHAFMLDPVLSAESGTGTSYLSPGLRQVFQIANFQPPAMRTYQAPLDDWIRQFPENTLGVGPNDGGLFLHGMQTPSGKSRLVLIGLDVSQHLKDADLDADGQVRNWSLETSRSLVARVFDPQTLPSLPARTAIRIEEPGGQHPRFTAQFTKNSEMPVTAQLVGTRPWKIFTGQLDPADPTHLTIAYEIAGVPGVIDGRLSDGDRLMLTPRVGRLATWTSANEYTWELAASPTTAPAK